MTRIYNPAHPGAVLKEYLGDVSVTTAAESLGVTRPALSRILNEKTGISADMEVALGVSAEMWVNMQAQHELWIALQHARPDVKRIIAHA